MKQLSKPEECRGVAAQVGSLAKGTADPVRKSEYEVLEAKWLRLACRLDAPAANRENIIPFSPRQNLADETDGADEGQ